MPPKMSCSTTGLLELARVDRARRHPAAEEGTLQRAPTFTDDVQQVLQTNTAYGALQIRAKHVLFEV
jgi:hypothetical protein